MSVPLSSGLKLSISRIISSICLRPFFGGMNFSTLSEKKITPTLSLFWIEEKARVAAISVMISFFASPTAPKLRLALTSMSNITVSSRSSSYDFTYGRLWRAVTFQSMSRISSPYWYSLTSENTIPRPLKAVWYSPAKMLRLNPRDLISIFLTFFKSSFASIGSGKSSFYRSQGELLLRSLHSWDKRCPTP